MKGSSRAVVAALIGALVVGCATGVPAPTGESTAPATPPAAVLAALAEVEAGDAPLTSLAVLHRGRSLGEAYGPGLDAGTPQPVWSVTKSVVSVLTGIAVEQGLLSLDTTLRDLLGEVAAGHPELTIEHLLTMTSGLDIVDSEQGLRELAAADDWVAAILDRPRVAPPGERFAYCSACVHLLTAALDEVTGGLAAWADDRLFAPLGLGAVRWDRATDGSDVPIGGWGLHLGVRQLARLGQLHLDGGVWEGRQLVPAWWVEESTALQVAGGSAFEQWQVGYGYLWWVQETGGYAATGRGGQLIVVVPRSELVVATTAELSDEDAFEAIAFVWSRVVAAVPVG